jgi:hypothetical protein
VGPLFIRGARPEVCHAGIIKRAGLITWGLDSDGKPHCFATRHHSQIHSTPSHRQWLKYWYGVENRSLSIFLWKPQKPENGQFLVQNSIFEIWGGKWKPLGFSVLSIGFWWVFHSKFKIWIENDKPTSVFDLSLVFSGLSPGFFGFWFIKIKFLKFQIKPTGFRENQPILSIL